LLAVSRTFGWSAPSVTSLAAFVEVGNTVETTDALACTSGSAFAPPVSMLPRMALWKPHEFFSSEIAEDTRATIPLASFDCSSGSDFVGSCGDGPCPGAGTIGAASSTATALSSGAAYFCPSAESLELGAEVFAAACSAVGGIAFPDDALLCPPFTATEQDATRVLKSTAGLVFAAGAAGDTTDKRVLTGAAAAPPCATFAFPVCIVGVTMTRKPL